MKLPWALHFSKIVSAFLVFVFLSLAPGANAKPAKPEQPLMHAALDSLRAARAAVDPLPDLQAAKHRLKAAIKNKGGYRIEALGIVNKAIDEVQAKRRHEANKLIDQAVTKIERGIAIGN